MSAMLLFSTADLSTKDGVGGRENAQDARIRQSGVTKIVWRRRKARSGILKNVGAQIKSALSNPWNTLSAKTLQGESPLGKHRYFSSSRSRQMQDLQSPVVRILISQAISASVNLFIEVSLVLLPISLCGGYNILFR